MDNVKNCAFYDKCNHKDCALDHFCLRKYKLDTLYLNALMTESQKKHLVLKVDADNRDLEAFKQLAAIEADIVNFIADGKNLFLHSAMCGNGKSSWSIRLLEAYFNKIWARADDSCHALFISVPRFLLAIKDNITVKSTYVEYIKDNVYTADIVVWDDLGSKTGSEFEISHLLNIIDNRIAAGKSNIYTSNLNRSQMYQALGDRLTSRVVNLSTDIEFFGADKRVLSTEVKE